LILENIVIIKGVVQPCKYILIIRDIDGKINQGNQITSENILVIMEDRAEHLQ